MEAAPNRRCDPNNRRDLPTAPIESTGTWISHGLAVDPIAKQSEIARASVTSTMKRTRQKARTYKMFRHLTAEAVLQRNSGPNSGFACKPPVQGNLAERP